jgi:CheY-like chemotaxis protein
MSRKILVIEDNPSDEKLTRLAFRNAGVSNEVVVARDGAEALERLLGAGGLAAHGELPAVVLLDLKLPKVDGLEVLEQIRRDDRTKYLPVVVLTSSREDEDVIKSYALGANAYVRKPVDFSEFAAAVKTLGLFWLLMNETAPPATP